MEEQTEEGTGGLSETSWHATTAIQDRDDGGGDWGGKDEDNWSVLHLFWRKSQMGCLKDVKERIKDISKVFGLSNQKMEHTGESIDLVKG